MHDNSYIAPNYILNVSDGTDFVTSFPNVTFISLPVIIAKNITIYQGQSTTLDNSMINAIQNQSGSSISKTDLVFYVSCTPHGHFQFIFLKIPILCFTQMDINQNFVQFVHDNSEQEPSCVISVSNGKMKTGSDGIHFTFYPKFIIVKNYFKLTNKQTLTISSENLAISFSTASDIDKTLITISEIQHLQFSISGNIVYDKKVSFTLQQIND